MMVSGIPHAPTAVNPQAQNQMPLLFIVMLAVKDFE